MFTMEMTCLCKSKHAKQHCIETTDVIFFITTMQPYRIFVAYLLAVALMAKHFSSLDPASTCVYVSNYYTCNFLSAHVHCKFALVRIKKV